MKDNFESALRFAMDAHSGQIDKGWTPYIQHLLGVWSRVRQASLTTQIVALLHDTVEDTDIVLDDIQREFGFAVAEAVEILTHDKKIRYTAYIENIAASKNRSAILVKLADLQDNMSEFRLQRLPEEKRAYFESRMHDKYEPARRRLLTALEDLK